MRCFVQHHWGAAEVQARRLAILHALLKKPFAGALEQGTGGSRVLPERGDACVIIIIIIMIK